MRKNNQLLHVLTVIITIKPYNIIKSVHSNARGGRGGGRGARGEVHM